MKARMWLFLLTAIGAAGAAAAAETCGCGCCLVAFRPPSMQINGVDLMCTPSDSCPEQCQAGDMNTAAASTDAGLMETSRYCMLDCLPRGRNPKLGCEELTQEQAKRLMTASGNGEDPAELAMGTPPKLAKEMPPQRPSLAEGAEEAVQSADVQAFQEMAAAAMAKAKEPPTPGITQRNIDTGALVADAAGKRAIAAGLSAQAGEANAKSAASVINSTYAYRRALLDAGAANEAKAKVLSAKVQAGIYAKAAEQAAKLAEQEIGEILSAPDKAAEEVAAEAEKVFREEIVEFNKEKAVADQAIVLGTTAAPSTVAGEQAAAPYVAAAQRVQTARFVLQEQSQQLANVAAKLRLSASKVLAQAKAYEAAGKQKVADDLTAQVDGLMRQAADAQRGSERDMQQANTMAGSQKAYLDQAGMASARADVISRLYWIPPPPVAGGGGGAAAPSPAASFLERDRPFQRQAALSLLERRGGGGGGDGPAIPRRLRRHGA